MIGRRAFLGLASFGLAASDLLAQDPKKSKARAGVRSRPVVGPDEQVNRILGQARTDGRRLPGMVGGILRGESLTNVGAVGVRKAGSPDSIRVNDLVHLGSCTKAMTATMLGTVVDEGKLRWDLTVGECFDEWQGEIHPDYSGVTLDQLMRHRAGLPHDLPWWEADRSLPVVEQRLALLAPSLRKAPVWKPGSRYAYSNTAYVLAAMMAERATGLSWEDLMKRRVFGPLGMASAGFGPTSTRGKVDQPWGHRASGDVVEAVHLDNPPAMGPAGTVHCSIADWARFGSYHLKGSLGGVRLVKPETLKALHTPHPGEEYAGGWISLERSWANGRALNHSGSNTMWYGTIWIAPERDFGMLVAVNAAGKPAEDASEEAIKGLLRYATTGESPRGRG